MIDALTPEQEALFPRYVDEWTRIGLCTEPADRPRAEAAVRWMYHAAGLPEPRIAWCGSPLSLCLARAMSLETLRDGRGAEALDRVRDSVGARVWDSVWDSVGARVGASVGARVYGQHDAAWLVFYRYFREVVGLAKETQPLKGLWELAQSAGWAIPCRDICFISERHTTLRRDARGRLHSLEGPALAYPDGFAIHAVHGVRVPEFVIERPGDITVAGIEAEENTEVRRVMITRYGAARYLQDAGATLVHEDARGRLWRKDRPDDTPLMMVEVVNSTPEPDGSFKHYWLRVKPDVKTASEAVAWTFGIEKAADYAPCVET